MKLAFSSVLIHPSGHGAQRGGSTCLRSPGQEAVELGIITAVAFDNLRAWNRERLGSQAKVMRMFNDLESRQSGSRTSALEHQPHCLIQEMHNGEMEKTET